MTYTDLRVETRGLATWITHRPPRGDERGAPADLRGARRCLPGCGCGSRHALHRADRRGARLLRRRRFQRDLPLGEEPSLRRSDGMLARYRSRTGPRTPIVGTILECTKPTIAAINGAAVGMGMDLALLCDMRIASDTRSSAPTSCGAA